MENNSVFEDLGMLFYFVNPEYHKFASAKDCPDYVSKAMPYMVVLMLVEAGWNTYYRGRRYNMADSITSISCGLLMTLAGLSSRFLMISTYSWLHQYSIIDLPWDSTVTWILAAIGIDLGYYWFHRASHEIGLLWAVHQVHHSSEEFNLTTALRQPFFEGLLWMTHWFYLPLALFIPTTQMLVHSELNFLFQFWIHTELMGDLGPVGLILNTASHHRVHHGANRYCIDKNYGGFLSIWDRIFGTFEEERKTEDIVYGLVDQPQFFNPLKLQLFYFQLLHNKSVSTGSWRAWLSGPGWFPGLPRLGDTSSLPESPTRDIWYSKVSKVKLIILLLQLATVALVHDQIFSHYSSLTKMELSILSSYILVTVYSLGLQLDGENSLEIVRCFFLVCLWVAGVGMSPLHGLSLQVVVISSILSLLHCFLCLASHSKEEKRS